MTVRRRFWAARWLALSLAVAGVLALSLLPMPYVVFSPGPTVNVLGKVDGHQVIQIEGRQTYRDSGDLRLTTVVVSSQSHKVNLFELLQAWFTPDHAIYPREVVYHKGDTNKSVQQQNAAEMTSSQDAAVAAALTELEIPITQVVKVLGVTPDGPSEGLLQIGDVVLAVDGRPVADSQDVINQVQARKIGDQVKLLVRREVAPKEKSDQSKQQDPPRSVEKTITVTTRAAATKPVKPIIGVVIGRGYEFPFTVDLGVGDSIGGPSGGLTFALGIYDLLTPGSLTGGKDIAGTGEINPDGRVGSIGGIQQKIAAAQGDGARLFLVPPDNCTEAVRANYDPKKMRLVRAETLDSAIKSLEAWSVDQSAKLPTCAKK